MREAVADPTQYQLNSRDAITHDQVGRDISALQAVLDAQMDALKERLVDLQHAIERIPIEQRAAVETAMTAAAKATDAALMAAKAAVDQAAIAHAREHALIAEALKQQQATYLSDKASANEWRTTVENLANLKIDGKEVQRVFEGVDGRLKLIEQALATAAGTLTAQRSAVQGQMWAFGAITTVLALLITVAGIVAVHLGK